MSNVGRIDTIDVDASTIRPYNRLMTMTRDATVPDWVGELSEGHPGLSPLTEEEIAEMATWEAECTAMEEEAERLWEEANAEAELRV